MKAKTRKIAYTTKTSFLWSGRTLNMIYLVQYTIELLARNI